MSRIMDGKLRIRQIKFTLDEMTCEAKAPARKRDFCLMDDIDILDREILVMLKKRIQIGIDKRTKPDPTGRD